MNETKRLRNTKKAGRERVVVTYDDFAKTPPTKTMLLLAELKNEGHSWQTLADEISARLSDDKVSHALVREVTLGHCNSPKIDYALGFRDQPPPVKVPPNMILKRPRRPDKVKRFRLCYEAGRGPAGRARDAQLRAEMARAGCESFTEWVDAMRLELKIRRGICPDCGNDSCMADGVTGLWCPKCDASYLLNER